MDDGKIRKGKNIKGKITQRKNHIKKKKPQRKKNNPSWLLIFVPVLIKS